MPAFKKILQSHIVHRILVWVLAMYIRLVFMTSRKQYHIHPEAKTYMRGEHNAIFAFWHGRMMMMPCLCPPHHQMHVLISLHRDGIFISDTMKEFGLKTIHGSTSKNGRHALMNMLRMLRHGDNVAITPDGPRGPHQVAAAGIVVAAKLSGKAVVPITFCAKNHKRFTSWDRFMLAWPFTQISFCVGAPIMIDKQTPDEESRIAVEYAMNRLTETADALLL